MTVGELKQHLEGIDEDQNVVITNGQWSLDLSAVEQDTNHIWLFAGGE